MPAHAQGASPCVDDLKDSSRSDRQGGCVRLFAHFSFAPPSAVLTTAHMTHSSCASCAADRRCVTAAAARRSRDSTPAFFDHESAIKQRRTTSFPTPPSPSRPPSDFLLPLSLSPPPPPLPSPSRAPGQTADQPSRASQPLPSSFQLSAVSKARFSPATLNAFFALSCAHSPHSAPCFLLSCSLATTHALPSSFFRLCPVFTSHSILKSRLRRSTNRRQDTFSTCVS